MKTIALLLASLALTGCTCAPGGSPAPSHWHASWRITVVNNTGYTLAVYQDGCHLATIETGQQCLAAPSWFAYRTPITVFAYDAQGHYLGTDSCLFNPSTPEVWQVDEVIRPHPSR